jgi:hypothetical protein
MGNFVAAAKQSEARKRQSTEFEQMVKDGPRDKGIKLTIGTRQEES